MNMKSTSLGFLGVSIGMGAIFSFAPLNPVQAGSLNREIINANGNKIGRIAFTWDDSIVTNNKLEGFNSLTSFSLTNYDDMSYDLNFAKNADFDSFDFNVSTGQLDIFAYNRTRATQTRKYGFEIKSENFDSDVIASSLPVSNLPNEQKLNQALTNNTYFINFNLGEPTSSDSITPSGSQFNGYSAEKAKFVPVEQDPQSVPENSLTTALLIIAGLVFLSPHKIF
ncbi:hypothetical protein [Cyanothece sp. BG0011]|uniref:hypothetical protein n=1 Tax=Cyanothece sp. BG0011 TaxID=2082950 RepID=UPI000D1F5F07|nr:hypothetical protein [Cyanothece sp. BG0011]